MSHQMLRLHIIIKAKTVVYVEYKSNLMTWKTRKNDENDYQIIEVKHKVR